ncbi:MAG TPA: hypothetical protein VNG33_16765 [Polyangiaceae bacterium]|nr:hypothetical protein [Polyangiaceae bacterium]
MLSVCAYFQFGRLPAGFVHRWEMFHYYVGAKYHAELGYKNLYRCAAVADAEDGFAQPGERRMIRDLDGDGLLRVASVLAQPERCKSRFSAARWSAFKHDASFFRRGLGKKTWAEAQLDHGYNPPPLWTATWGKLCELVPASLRHLQLLAAADVALMLGVLGALGLGFGWRVAALGAVFWGTQAASEVGWTGGGLGRQDWLFLCVAGAALLRRQSFGWGGAALALAGLLRLFPLLLLAGPGVVWLAAARARGEVPVAARRFALGAALALSAGLAVSVAHSGASDYREFWSHIQLRREAIVNNHMGLKTLLSAAPVPVAVAAHVKSEPRWVEQRRARLQALNAGYVVILSCALLLVGAALWQARRAWVGAALATALIPLTLDPSNYYYSFFILLVPLVAQKRSLGVLLSVVAAGGQLLSLRFAAPELRFAALSWLYVGVALVVALAFVRWPRLAFSWERGSTCRVTS